MTYNMASGKKYEFGQRYRDIFSGKVEGVELNMYCAFVPTKDDMCEIIYSPYAVNNMGLMNDATKALVWGEV